MTGHRTGPSLPYGRLWIRRRDLADRRPRRSNGRSWVLQLRRRDSESSVDDLGTWRGVVLGRAVTTLRSVETQPYAWGFVLSVRRDPTEYSQENYMKRREREREREKESREKRRKRKKYTSNQKTNNNVMHAKYYSNNTRVTYVVKLHDNIIYILHIYIYYIHRYIIYY